MKKITSIILAAIMLIGIFTVMPLSASAATIKQIDVINVFRPAAGNRPDTTAGVTQSNCSVDSIYWYNQSDSKWMGSNETFVSGKKYQVNVHVKASSGSSFYSPDSEIKATVNSNSASVSHVTLEDPEEYLNISYTFTATSANTKITSVSLSGVVEPEAGNKAKISFTDGSPYYDVDCFQWRLPDDHIFNENSVFEPNSTYEARFYLIPKSGYQFSSDLTGTINGKTAKTAFVSGYSNYEKIIVRYSFTTGALKQTISSVSITGVVEPKVGESPSSSASVSQDAAVDGVSWFNVTDGYWLDVSDTFKSGKEYRVRVYVKANDGFKFSADSNSIYTTATINGKSATVASAGGDNEKRICANYNFSLAETPTEPATEPATEPQHVHEWGEWTVLETSDTEEAGIEIRECLEDPSHTETRPIARIASMTCSGGNFTYTGKQIKPAVIIKDSNGKKLVKDTDYRIEYSKYPVPISPDLYIINIFFKGKYAGIESVEYTINKAKNPMKVTVTNKSVKYSTVKKKDVTVTAIKVTKAQGTVSYKKMSGNSKIKVNAKTGKLTVKKGLKKGTYKVSVKVTAKGNSNYKSANVTKTVTIKVK